jgi:uncharacterized membrane protein
MTSEHAEVRPYIERNRRNLPANAAFGWLASGWRDFLIRPELSLAYGLAVFAISLGIVWALIALGHDYILFPALAGFMVVGPLLAIGLYQKSRAIMNGEPLSLSSMIFVRAKSGAQVWFTGAILCLLMLTWMRAAVIIYALFFGLRPSCHGDAVHHRYGLGNAFGRQRCRGHLCRVLIRDQHLLDSHAA